MRFRTYLIQLTLFVVMAFGRQSSGQGMLFQQAINYPSEWSPEAIAAGDWNSDGNIDLIVGGAQYGDKLALMLNNGDGTFGSAIRFQGGYFNDDIVPIDIDGDSDLDLVIADEGQSRVVLMRNTGGGIFEIASSCQLDAGGFSLVVADFDQDSDYDIAVPTDWVHGVALLRNQGGLVFQVSYILQNAIVSPVDITGGDFDGDGKTDLAFPNRVCPACGVSSNTVAVMRNTGNMSFAAPIYLPTGGENPFAIVSTDLNADGHLDIATANYNSGDVSVFENNGDGSFSSAMQYDAPYNDITISTADIDDDGDNDIILGAMSDPSNPGMVTILTNSGEGNLSVAEVYETGSATTDIVSRDFDGDGDIDLATANQFGHNVSVLINRTTHLPSICGTSGLLFCDDFDHGASPTWQSPAGSQPGSCTWTVVNGTYGSSEVGTDRLCLRSVIDHSWQNYVYEVDVRGTAGLDKEVTFRSQDGLNTYDLNLIGEPANQLHLNKVVDGVSHRLATASYVNGLFEWYHLKVTCLGPRITAAVNGQELIQYVDVDQPFLSGGIGLVVWTGATGLCNVRFDNVLVRGLDNNLRDFSPTVNGWRFTNATSQTWPYVWPLLPYPSFIGPPAWDEKCDCGAAWVCWPTWEIMRNAFGEDQIENDDGDRWPAAEEWWTNLKQCANDFAGSCYGMVSTALLFFNDYHMRVPTEFPGSSNLHDVLPTDAGDRARELIATYILYQWGVEQQAFRRTAQSNTPVETYVHCLEMFNEVPGNRSFLAIDALGHVVNPYQCTVDPENNDLLISVYDNQLPGIQQTIIIDLDQTPATWTYRGRTETDGLYLMDPLSNYTQFAQFPVTTGGESSWLVRRGESAQVMSIYFSQVSEMSIVSSLGRAGFVNDSTFSSVDSASPIVPFLNGGQRPIGFRLPIADWTIDVMSESEESSALSIFTDKSVLSVALDSLSGSAQFQVIYDSSSDRVMVRNLSGQTMRCQLKVITVIPDSEVVCDVRALGLLPGDSIQLRIIPDIGFEIDNTGGSVTYDIHMQAVGSLTDSAFYHGAVPMDSNSTHRILSNWPQSGQLTILVDEGMTGTFVDTLLLLGENEPSTCCVDSTGNVDCDFADGVDIGDLTTLIDNLFISFTPLCCEAEANCDGAGGIDIGDLTALIDNLFITFTPLAGCQ